MPKKDLKSSKYKPTLVNMYESHTRKVYNDYVHVPNTVWGKFLVLQEELMSADIGLLEYTETVLISLKTWVVDHGLLSVPHHIFISDFAVEKFMRLYSKKTIKVSMDEDYRFFNDELTLFRYYILKHLENDQFTLCQAVADLKPVILTGTRLELYRRDMNPHMNTLMALAEEYGAKIVSLDAIIEAARGR